jgi:Effector Associated Constant Component 1
MGGGQLITEVTVGGGREADLRSLHDWLRREPSLRQAEVALKQAPARAGSMGSWVEAVQMITDNGWQAASFVLSLMTWRQTRADSPQVTIRRGDVEVTVPSGNPEEAARIAVLLQQAVQIAPADHADRGNERQDAASDRAASGDGGGGATAGTGDDGEGREG